MSTKTDRLATIKCFLMDMDGTIFLGNQLLPGAEDWLALLRKRGIAHYFLTNNSSRSQLDYVKKLKNLGLSVPEEKIFTSGEATVLYLQKEFPEATLYVVGTPSLQQEFARHGFSQDPISADVAVLGFDTTLTYEKLWRLCDLVTAGKPYIATHPDINCPIENGFKPDIGAMIALVAASTGRRPDVIVGKPYAPIVNALADKTGFAVEEHCMIGDRLYTDIALGQWGMTTALVLSGETRLEDVASSPFQPDFVVRDVAEMADLYRQAISAQSSYLEEGSESDAL